MAWTMFKPLSALVLLALFANVAVASDVTRHVDDELLAVAAMRRSDLQHMLTAEPLDVLQFSNDEVDEEVQNNVHAWMKRSLSAIDNNCKGGRYGGVLCSGKVAASNPFGGKARKLITKGKQPRKIATKVAEKVVKAVDVVVEDPPTWSEYHGVVGQCYCHHDDAARTWALAEPTCKAALYERAGDPHSRLPREWLDAHYSSSTGQFVSEISGFLASDCSPNPPCACAAATGSDKPANADKCYEEVLSYSESFKQYVPYQVMVGALSGDNSRVGEASKWLQNSFDTDACGAYKGSLYAVVPMPGGIAIDGVAASKAVDEDEPPTFSEYHGVVGQCYCRYDDATRTWALSEPVCKAALYERSGDPHSRLPREWLNAQYAQATAGRYTEEISSFLASDCSPAPPCSCRRAAGSDKPADADKCFEEVLSYAEGFKQYVPYQVLLGVFAGDKARSVEAARWLETGFDVDACDAYKGSLYSFVPMPGGMSEASAGLLSLAAASPASQIKAAMAEDEPPTFSEYHGVVGQCYCRFDDEARAWALTETTCRAALYERAGDVASRLPREWLDAHFSKETTGAFAAEIGNFLMSDCSPAPPCACRAAAGSDKPADADKCFEEVLSYAESFKQYVPYQVLLAVFSGDKARVTEATKWLTANFEMDSCDAYKGSLYTVVPLPSTVTVSAEAHTALKAAKDAKAAVAADLPPTWSEYHGVVGQCYCRFDEATRAWALSEPVCKAALYERAGDAHSSLPREWLNTQYAPATSGRYTAEISNFLASDCSPAPPCSCAAAEGSDKPADGAKCFEEVLSYAESFKQYVPYQVLLAALNADEAKTSDAAQWLEMNFDMDACTAYKGSLYTFVPMPGGVSESVHSVAETTVAKAETSDEHPPTWSEYNGVVGQCYCRFDDATRTWALSETVCRAALYERAGDAHSQLPRQWLDAFFTKNGQFAAEIAHFLSSDCSPSPPCACRPAAGTHTPADSAKCFEEVLSYAESFKQYVPYQVLLGAFSGEKAQAGEAAKWLLTSFDVDACEAYKGSLYVQVPIKA